MPDKQQDITVKLYSIAEQLRAVANEGLQHFSNEYNERRYEKILELSKRLYNILNDKPLNIEKDFRDNTGIQTPFIGAEAAVFRDDKQLLIKRNDTGLWAVPGGGADVGETLAEAALRELKEETGLTGSITRLLGIFDSRIWKSRLKSQVFHVIFEVAVENGEPEKTIEAIDFGFFGRDKLPQLSPGHDERVPFIFRLYDGEIEVPYLDGLDRK